ncbi:MAG: SMP-30/gluconolactonase/LRE family protein [Proteobacteria bacterium]|nr:SMP-30/gluconolactonase/LRE family protein [Pseudomonadota bacterium]
MGKTDILLDGLCFGEGPRWHEDQLWLSDMHAHEVLRVSTQGVAEHVVSVENRPSGLGWLPDGDLLIVSMIDCKLLRFDGTALTTHADLSALASFHCNDMVVDAKGRAYVGNFGFDLHNKATPRAAELILVEPDGSARVVADDMMFPNGTVITADGRTLIVGESWGGTLTAFDIGANGDLSNRRTWAELPRGAIPDGICLDTEGGIWSASPSTDECLRQVEGGEVTHRVALGQGAFACILGGDDLYILTASSSEPDVCKSKKSGRIEVIKAPYPGAGWP